MRKIWLVGAVSLVLVAGACSSGGHQNPKGPVSGGVSAVASALKAEGAQVNLYWPTNADFTKFIQGTIVPGFEQHIKDTYGVDIKVNVLEAAGGDQAFLTRLKANGGRSNFGIDVDRTAPGAALLDAIDNGLLQSLSDHEDVLPHLKDIDPKGTAVFTKDGKVYGAPIYEPTMSLFYHSASVPAPPTTLDALLQYAQAHKGKVTYEDPQANTSSGSGTMFLLAVMHKFGTVTDPSTWAPGWSYLQQLQKVVAAQPTSGDQLLDQFARGEIQVFPYWNDGGLFGKDELKISDMKNVLLDDGFPVRYTPFVIPKGAAHPTAAFLFTDWVLGPAIQKGFATVMHQIPSSTAADVTSAFTDETFGFPLVQIRAKNFPAYDSRQALTAVGQLTTEWSAQVLNR